MTLLRSAAPRLAYSNRSSERINAFTRIVVKYMKIVAPKRYLILAIFLVPIWYSNALISSFTYFLRTSLKCGTDSWLTRMVLIYLVSALTRIQHLSNMLHFIFAYAILLILVLMCVVPVSQSYSTRAGKYYSDVVGISLYFHTLRGSKFQIWF